MPNIELKRDALFERMKRVFTDHEFDEFLFEYGLELDDVTSERDKKLKETGILDLELSDEVIYKIDVPANRYDLLCEEGIGRALMIYLGLADIPEYKILNVSEPQVMVVDPSVKKVRPYVVCAILRNITFTETNYQNFITLQTKLHTTLARKRSLASIGTHDLDTIKGPFSYEALKPEDINFVPLNKTQSVNGHELMQTLESDTHLSQFLHLIRDEPLYPVIYDSNRNVLSLPPIINSEHSKITLNTKNVFIEVTAPNEERGNIVLNTVVTMFSEYCADPFSIEPVLVVDGESRVLYPQFEQREIKAEVEYITSGLGVDISAEDIIPLLKKMCVPSRLSEDKQYVISTITPTRTDIFHKCDIVEDVIIGYGINNLDPSIPQAYTPARQFNINYVADKVRGEIGRGGYTELLSFSLLKTAENFEYLNKVDDGSAVVIENPASLEFEVVRTSLLPGILKTISSNKDVPLPLKLFEVSDVVRIDTNSTTGARNRREVCALYTSPSQVFEHLHGLLDQVLRSLRVHWKDIERGYVLRPSEHPTYLKGRQADIVLSIEGKEHVIGTTGVLHPSVLYKFGLSNPCSVFEFDLEFFVELAADQSTK
jgi:phenylalanyl-tRNA synthetase beta chain